MADTQDVPKEASDALRLIGSTLGSSVVAVYLFGSAVVGGLRPKSDVDVLVIVDRPLPEATRTKLVEGLMRISGPVGDAMGRRPIELTVLSRSDIVPWRYPPTHQLVYGEWLRHEIENGRIAPSSADPDLAIVLKNVRDRSVPLLGPDASVVLDPVPIADVRRAMQESLPVLIAGMSGDERNVLLTLARMWLTAAEGVIAPKDTAADWAIAQLHGEEASLLDLARRGYLGEYADSWAGEEARVSALVTTMKQAIEACLVEQPHRS
jgi:aminoglycoside 9-adenylyltransferase